jgi:hypothetical protein
MQAYQLAIAEGGFAKVHSSVISAGAELVYLSGKSKKATVRSQPQIDVDEVRAEIQEIAEGMAASTFVATINDHCARCGVRGSCPVQSDGRAVME